MSAFKDITGRRFGQLVAISARRVAGRTEWTMQCDCGRLETVRLSVEEHRELKAAAARQGLTLQALLTTTLKTAGII